MSARRFCGVRLREEPGHRHLREERIAVVGVAVVVGELDGLVHGVDVVGRVGAHRLQVHAFQDVQRLEEHRPLVPRARLVDVEAVEVRRDRLLDAAVVGGEVVVGEHAARGAIGLRDPARDVAGVEGVAAGANRGDAVVTLRVRGLLGGHDRAQRAREVRLAEDLADLRDAAVRVVGLRRPLVLLGRLPLADEEVAEELVHREAVGELDRGRHHLLEAHRALLLERERHRVHHRRDRRAERTVAGNEARRFEERRVRRLRRRPLTADDDDLLRLRVVDHRRDFAAEAEVRDLDDRRREDRRDARVDGVAALLEDAHAGFDRVVPSRGDDPVRPEDLGPHRRRALRRDARRLLRVAHGDADGRDGPRDRDCHSNLQSEISNLQSHGRRFYSI